MRVVLFLAELFAPLENVDKCVYKLPFIFFVCLVVSQKFYHNAVFKTVVLMKYGYGCINDIQVIFLEHELSKKLCISFLEGSVWNPVLIFSN